MGNDTISRQAAIDSIMEEPSEARYPAFYAEKIRQLPPEQPETTKEYNLKNIYNIYVKIAQAHFVYQPSKPKTITAMPFDWIETQNLLEKYLKDHGADFDALCREYVSENVKDDYLPFEQQKGERIKGRCGLCMTSKYYESACCPNCGKEMEHD